MKKLFIILFVALAYSGVLAQKPFPLLYKSQWPVDVKWRYSNTEKTLALAGDLQEIAMLDATNGKLLWQMNFKDKLGIKNAKDWGWDEDKGVVWVKTKGESKSEEVTTWFDERTGDKIDDVTNRVVRTKVKYTRAAKSGGLRYKASIDDDKRNIHLNLLYKSKLATSSAGKGTKLKITVESSGAYSWNTEFEGRVLRALCDNAIGDGYSGDYISMELHGDHIFVIYEGISVFDVKTGKKLWETTFDNIEFNFGLMKSTQVLGRAAMPVVSEDAVFIADLSKSNHKIKKFNADNGTLIWESVEFGKGDLVPDMALVGNALIAKFGGEVETQTYIPGTDGRPDVCKDEYKMDGPFGLKAYDPATGALLWETSKMKSLGDKFSGSLSNIMISGNNIIFCTSKNMICMEARSGNMLWKVDISKTGIGIVNYIWERDGSMIAEGNKGVASVAITGGKLNWATKTKKNLGTFGSTSAYYVWVGKSITDYQNFIRIDLDNGAILGIQKATRYPQFTPDREEFLKYDGKKIYRFRARS